VYAVIVAIEHLSIGKTSGQILEMPDIETEKLRKGLNFMPICATINSSQQSAVSSQQSAVSSQQSA